MAAIVMVLLLVTAPLIQGHGQPDQQLEKRLEALEKRGEELHALISSLLQRLDGQDHTLQTQSRLLEKQKFFLDIQNERLQAQSDALEKQRLLLQDYARDARELKSLLWRQSSQKKTHGSEVTRKRLLDVIIHIHSQVQDVDGLELKVDSNGVNKPTEGTRNKSNLGNRREGKASMAAPRNSDTSTGSERSKGLVLDAKGPIAFHAVIDESVVTHIGHNQNIVFETVLENLGGGYHNQHGVFIAPANGVYIFSVSILSYIGDHSEFQVALKKDNVTLAKAFGHGYSGRNDQGSVTVATQLRKGNEVWVSLMYPNDNTISGVRFSSFMGCLVNPL